MTASSARILSSWNIRQFSSTLSIRFLDACNMCPTKNAITNMPIDVEMAVQGGNASSLNLQQKFSLVHHFTSLLTTVCRQSLSALLIVTSKINAQLESICSMKSLLGTLLQVLTMTTAISTRTFAINSEKTGRIRVSFL